MRLNSFVNDEFIDEKKYDAAMLRIMMDDDKSVTTTNDDKQSNNTNNKNEKCDGVKEKGIVVMA